MAHSARNRVKKSGKWTKGRTTRNRDRKLRYLKLAEQARTSRGDVSTSPGRPGRLQRTNHRRGEKAELKAIRQLEAKVRQTEHDNLTTQQKLDKLDQRFGKDHGAAKERLKLKTLAEKPVVVETKKDLKTSNFKVIYGGKNLSHKQQKKEAHDKLAREQRDGRNGK